MFVYQVEENLLQNKSPPCVSARVTPPSPQGNVCFGVRGQRSRGGLFTPGLSDLLTGVCVRVCVCVCVRVCVCVFVPGGPRVTVATRDAGPGGPRDPIVPG